MTIRVGGAAPPAASRCCARTSLPTPRGEPRFGVDCASSRGDPPHDGASPDVYLTGSEVLVGAAESKRFGVNRIDATGVPTAASTYAGGRRGEERAARYERSSDWRRGAQRARPVWSSRPKSSQS